MAKDDPRRPENQLLPADFFNPHTWYVAVTKPQKEFAVEWSFREMGLDPYCPRVLQWRRPRNRPRDPRPLFPRYLFVHLHNPHQYYRARWTPNVHGFVTMDNRPAALSDALVDEIRNRENQNGLIEEPPLRFTRGERIMVMEGLFEGLQGFFLGSRKGDRVKVVIQQRGKGATVVLEIEDRYLCKACG